MMEIEISYIPFTFVAQILVLFETATIDGI